jgi:tetratricopeptide (TPR) repeat protein
VPGLRRNDDRSTIIPVFDVYYIEMIKPIRLFCGAVTLFFLLSCIPQMIPQEALLDTPLRHYENGMKLLQSGKVDASYKEFNRALELDREYAPGYVGLGLVAGIKGNYKEALEKLIIAGLYTRNRKEAVMVHVGFMRVHLMGRDKISQNWLEKIEERYERSILLAPEIPDHYFVMGLAYKISGMPDKALEQFLHVVELNKEFAHEASDYISKIQMTKSNQ